MRSLFLFLLLFLFPLLLVAQVRSGPRVGLALATISGGGSFQLSGLPKLGPIAGWSFEVPWTRQASFLIEPMYISKGSVVQNAAQQTWTSVRLGYLEMPVILKMSLDSLPGGLFLSAGVIGGYWVNGRQIVKQNGNVLFDNKYELQGNLNRKQLSVSIGFGVDKGKTSFEVRTQTSVTPFSPIITGQNLVVGLHLTRYLGDYKTGKDPGDPRDD